MNLIIRNRSTVDPTSGWIHIVPKGELPNAEAGVVQVLDDVALDAILANIAADQQKRGDRWPGIYAGEEHFIYDDTKSSAAFGWFKNFEKRSDGLWASAEGLTDLGRQAVDNKRFKFTSFVARKADAEPLDGNRVRIRKIHTIGFTNNANGAELLAPMTNRNTFAGPADAGSVENTNPQQKTQRMKTVCALLGLSADADESNVHAEVVKLQNRATAAEEAATPLKNRVSALETENSALLKLQVESDLAKYANRIKPESKEAVQAALLKNRADTIALLEAMPEPVISNQAPATGNLLNRAGALTPGRTSAPAKPDQARAAVDDYRIKNRCSFEVAWAAVKRDKPELFSGE